MTKNDFTLGIEIEGAYRTIATEGGYGSQNSECLNSFWNASEDSSIESDKFEDDDAYCDYCDEYCRDCGCSPEDNDSEWQPVEVVSDILNTRNYKEALKSFQSLAQSGKNELHKDIEFNDSMGCHIHFKTLGKRSMKDMFSVDISEKFYLIFKRRMNHAMLKGMVPRPVGTAILNQYYRDYAKKNNGNKENRNSLHWSNEFKTLEWRSFNLTDVKTWKTFHKMFDIAVATIDEAINRRFQVQRKFEIRQGDN